MSTSILKNNDSKVDNYKGNGGVCLIKRFKITF